MGISKICDRYMPSRSIIGTYTTVIIIHMLQVLSGLVVSMVDIKSHSFGGNAEDLSTYDPCC